MKILIYFTRNTCTSLRQCEELEEYLRGKGAEVTSSSDTELLQRLQHIIEKCDVVFQQKELPPQGKITHEDSATCIVAYAVFSPAYLRNVGPTSLQYRIPFDVGIGIIHVL